MLFSFWFGRSSETVGVFSFHVVQHIAFLDLMESIDVICCSRNLNLDQMKNKILITAFLIALLCSCEGTKDPASVYTKRYLVVTTNNENWTNALIECDSLKMQDLTHVQVYSDGVKTDIFAKRITVASNPYFKTIQND